jgi:hypothetical protein
VRTESSLKYMDYEVDKKDLALRDAVVDGALQLVPVLGSIYAGAKTYRERIEEVNQEAFFEEVNTYPGIPKEKLLSNSFARRVLITMEAASKTESIEKIRILARMLRTSANVEEKLEFDDYKYHMDIVSELSPKELAFLSILHELFSQSPNQDDLGGERWLYFESIIIKKLGIPNEEIQSFITRLLRTGCIEQVDTMGAGLRAKLSPVHQKLQQLITDTN